MSTLSKVRDALTRCGIDSAVTVLAKLAIIAVFEIVGMTLILLVIGDGR